MPFDAFTISHTAIELKNALIGGKINKITQPSNEEVVFTLYAQGKTRKMIISSHAQNARVGFTNCDRPSPQVAPNFCMLLRKHLIGAEILDIYQVEFERVIIIDLNCKNDLFEHFKKSLIVEIMGKYSNVVLVQDGVIIGALKQASLELNPDRPIFSGIKYTLPKKQDKLNPFDKEKVIEYLKNYSNQDFSDYLFKGISGIADLTAKEIATRYPIICGKEEDFYDNFIKFLSNPEISPCVYYTQDFKDFTLYNSKYLALQGQKYDDILTATCDFFDKKETEKSFNLKKNSLVSKVNSHIKKQEKKKASNLQTLLQSEESEENKIKGELILSNIYKINKGDETLITENFYTDNSPIKINLDKMLSPQDNAKRYFKKYNKQKNAIKYAQDNLAEIESELGYLNSVLSEINSCENLLDLTEVEKEMASEGLIKIKQDKKGKKVENFRVYHFDGITVRVGRNNIQNDLLRQTSSPSDMWFHAKSYHSAFVVASLKGATLTDKVKLFCAQLCAYFSENKHGDKTEIDYTQIRFVKKPPKSRAGSVIYTNQQSILVEPNPHKEFEQ